MKVFINYQNVTLIKLLHLYTLNYESVYESSKWFEETHDYRCR